MPLSLEPGIKYPIVLDSDADKPKESQPTFFAQSLSMRAQKQVADVLDLLNPTTELTTGEIFEATCKKLSEVLIGWKNMGPHVFGSVDLQDVLTYAEAREILRKVMFNQHVTADEKKSSESLP